MSIASICVLVSCLVLTGAAELISVNIEKEVDSVGKTNETTVYIKDGASDLEAVYIGKTLRNLIILPLLDFTRRKMQSTNLKIHFRKLYLKM